MKTLKKLLSALLVGMATQVSAAPAFPNKTVSIVVPYGPGSGADTLARVLAEQLAPVLKVPVIVENHEGAGGTIGTQYVAKSKPDGYTLLFHTNAFLVAPELFPTPPYRLNQFRPVSKFGVLELAIVSSATLPYKTFDEMIAYAKAHPEKAHYATSGKGAASHLESARVMSRQKGVMIEDVPYKNVGQALTDTLAGRVLFYVPVLAATMPHINDGKLNVLAAGGRKRSAMLPNAPSIAEVMGSDSPEYTDWLTAWYGMMAPAGTPDDVVQVLYDAIAQAVQTPQVKDRLAAIGGRVALMNPKDFQAEMTVQAKEWATLVKDFDIRN